MVAEQSDKKWIIKSENKILGPYNFEQVENLLFKKQISLIDEIRDSQTRWLYIRENPEFKKVIDDVRSQLDSKSEATTTQQSHSSSTGTRTVDESNPLTRTPAHQFTNVSLTTEEASIVNEKVNDLIERIKSNESSAKTSAQTQYVYQNDSKIKQQVQLFSKNFILLFIVFLVLTAGSLGGYYFYNKYSQQKIEADMLTQVKKYKYLGLAQQATALYAKLPIQLQKKHLIEVIELFPLFEMAGLFQTKDLDDLEKSGKLTLENRVSIYMSRFWFFMQTQNLDSAQNEIVKAKTLLPLDSLINENEAILNIRKGQYATALVTLLKLYNDKNNGRYIVGAIQCLQGLSQIEKAKYFPVVEKLVDRHIALNFDYRKELLLVQMAFAKMHDNTILFKLSWKQFINTPAQLSLLFIHPSLLAPFAYQWKDLEPYKVIVRQGLNSADDTLFKIHDYLESAQLSAAVDYAEKNKESIADIATRQQISLLIYYALNKKNEILALEQTNQLDKKSELNNILLALTKVNIDPYNNISSYLTFFRENHLKFYLQWVGLVALINKGSYPEIRAYLKENFPEETNFLIVSEARGLLD